MFNKNLKNRIMGNCLKTQLKEVVNNDNLPYFGKGIIDVNADTSVEIRVSSKNLTSYLDVVGTGTITCEGVTGTHVLCYNSTVITLSAGQYKVLYDKYNTVIISAETNKVKIHIEDFKYNSVPGVQDVFYRDSIIGEIKDFNALSSLTRIYAPGSAHLEGDIAELNLVNLVHFDINASYVYGDISNLAKNLSLADIKIANTKLSGSVEGLAIAFRNKGKSEGSLSLGDLGYGNNNITWKGIKIVEQNNCSMSWTASTITFNGETINA